MIEWQMVDPGQELSSRNGSAILRIARELQRVAQEAGNEAWIVGGNSGQPSLPRCHSVLVANTPTETVFRFLDKSFRFLFGSPLKQTLVFQQSRIPTPESIVLHNMPWAGAEMRKLYPAAHITLYVHNRILNGVPGWAARRVLGYFDQIVCVSDFIRNDLQFRSGVKPGNPLRFETILNASRSDLIFTGTQAKYDVVYIGRLVREKGVHVLMSSASLAGRRWKVAIVGGKYFLPGHDADPYVESIRAQAAQGDLDVKFTGPIPPSDVLEYLGSARVIVIPSTWDEPGALSLLEAMASPAAVVASRVGGLPEMSREGGVVFVDPGSASQLREAVDALLTDEDRRLRVASAGQREVAMWSWRDVYGKLTNY